MKGFPAVVAFLGPWMTVAAVAESGPWVRLDPMPVRLPVVQDHLGFAWQLTSAGSFYTTGGNVFESANQLSVNGERFAAATLERMGNRHRFTATGNGWMIRREVWIDRDRSAAFCLEEVRNETGETREATLDIATVFSVPWKGWSARDGKAFVNGAPPPPSSGAFLTFPPRDGESDVFFLLGDERASVRPRLSAEDRVFAARYASTVPAGGTLRILHGIGQRRLGPGTERESRVFDPFFEEGRLVGPGDTGPVANFPAEALDPVPGAASAAWELTRGRVLDVREDASGEIVILASVGRVRARTAEIIRFEDQVWRLKDGTVLRGVALPGQRVRVQEGGEGSGPIDVAMADVVAIRSPESVVPRGGRLRLRNGDCLAGRPAETEWSMVVDGRVLRFEVAAVRRLGRAGRDGIFAVEGESGETRRVGPSGTWLAWERDGNTWNVPWEWIEGYEREG